MFYTFVAVVFWDIKNENIITLSSWSIFSQFMNKKNFFFKKKNYFSNNLFVKNINRNASDQNM